MNDLISTTEKLVPAMCELMALEGMAAHEGFGIAPEHHKALYNSLQLALVKMTEDERSTAVTKAYNAAETLLYGEHSGTWRQLMLTACMFVCKLVAEGLPVDPQSQAVLIGLSVLEEASHDETGEWGFDKAKLEEAAGRMLSRARLLGLFFDKSLAP